MKKSRLFSVVVGALGLFFAMPALAFAPEATCESWSTYSPWGGPAYAEASAFLEVQEADSSWTLVDGRVDSQLLTAAGDFSLGGMWFDAATSVLATGDYRVRLHVTVYANATSELDDSAKASWPAAMTFAFPERITDLFACEAPPPVVDYGMALSPGYWKNHESAWQADSLVIGATSYPKSCLLAFFDLPTKGDIRIPLLHHVFASKLNLLNNSNPYYVTAYPTSESVVTETVQAADAYIISSGTQLNCTDVTLSGAAPKGDTKTRVAEIKSALDAYNNDTL